MPQFMLDRFPFDRAYPVTSPFNAWEKGLRKEPHRGVDFGSPEGTPIYAPAPGVIHKAHSVEDGPNGLHVVLQTLDGRGQGWFIHLSRVDVEKGQKVQAGQRLGLTGNTGVRCQGDVCSPVSTGPHLHLGWFRKGKALNVLDHLPPPPGMGDGEVDVDGNPLSAAVFLLALV